MKNRVLCLLFCLSLSAGAISEAGAKLVADSGVGEASSDQSPENSSEPSGDAEKSETNPSEESRDPASFQNGQHGQNGNFNSTQTHRGPAQGSQSKSTQSKSAQSNSAQSYSERYLNSSLTTGFQDISSARSAFTWTLSGIGAGVAGIGLLVSDKGMKQWLYFTGGAFFAGGLLYLTPLAGVYGGCEPGALRESLGRREECLSRIADAKKRHLVLLGVTMTAVAAAGVYSTIVKPGSNAATGYVYTDTGQGTETTLQTQWIFNSIYALFAAIFIFAKTESRELDRYHEMKAEESKKANVFSPLQFSYLPIKGGAGLATTWEF